MCGQRHLGRLVVTDSVAQITADADKFPLFLRGLSGISCAYCLFTFPTEVHLNSYIQAMPSIMDFINHMKLVLLIYIHLLHS